MIVIKHVQLNYKSESEDKKFLAVIGQFIISRWEVLCHK